MNANSTRAPPPAYNRVVNKVTRGKSLRPIILLCILLGFIWCAVVAASNFRGFGDAGVSGKLLAAYIIQAALFTFLCLLAVAGFVAAYKATPKAGKAWLIITVVGSATLLGAQICRIALHFAFKRDITNACEVQERDNYPTSTLAEIADWCASDWKNDIWRIIAWSIFAVVCAVFMIILARSFYHQLLDPNFGRVQQSQQYPQSSFGQAPSDRYRMGALSTPYGNAGPAPEDLPFSPPYSAASNVPEYGAAPPMYAAPEKGSAYAGVGSDAKHDGRKDSMVDARMEEQGFNADSPHDRDLAGQVEPLNSRHSRSDSDDTLQGRRREGRI